MNDNGWSEARIEAVVLPVAHIIGRRVTWVELEWLTTVNAPAKEARRGGKAFKPQTLEFARYVIVFTTFPRADFTPEAVLDWVRLRWQVERVFKRFKSIAQLGNLPKHDDASARARLYGKLYTALLTEKLIAHASTVSPRGYDLPTLPHGQPMTGIQVHPQSGQANN